jgi:hypothetical protein
MEERAEERYNQINSFYTQLSKENKEKFDYLLEISFEDEDEKLDKIRTGFAISIYEAIKSGAIKLSNVEIKEDILNDE